LCFHVDDLFGFTTEPDFLDRVRRRLDDEFEVQDGVDVYPPLPQTTPPPPIPPVEVEEEDDVFTIYATDHPFQSLVYSLQNMDYEIDQQDENNWVHKISYTLYNCKFSAVKVLIKNVKKIRDEKINEILS
jgi:hypothetical protein